MNQENPLTESYILVNSMELQTYVSLDYTKLQLLKRIVDENYTTTNLEEPKAGNLIIWLDNPGLLTNILLKISNLSFTTVKVNHFIGMTEIGVKNHLIRNLNRAALFFPEHYNFHPLSVSLPLENEAINSQIKWWIAKPSASCEGRGISLISAEEISSSKLESGTVIQEYITNPLLIDGLKFDLRLYVLITRLEPLQIGLYKDGLVRLCTHPYEIPNEQNYDNHFMHLTNYTVNKSSSNYQQAEESPTSSDLFSSGSKRNLKWLLSWIRDTRGDEVIDKLIMDIHDVISKTIISAHPMIASIHRSNLKGSSKIKGFELLGFDLLIDDKFKPWILEVNQSPSLSTDTPVDDYVKKNLMKDVFKIVCSKSNLFDDSTDFWCIYDQLKGNRFKNLFCFPFPKELLASNDYLNQNELNQLLNIIQNKSNS